MTETPFPEFTAGVIMEALDTAVRAAAQSGLLSEETLNHAYAGLRRHELLERSRFRNTAETAGHIEDALANPGPQPPPWDGVLTKPPADATHLVDLLAAAAAAAHWSAGTACLHLPEDPVPHSALRITTKDGTVHRLAVAHIPEGPQADAIDRATGATTGEPNGHRPGEGGTSPCPNGPA